MPASRTRSNGPKHGKATCDWAESQLTGFLGCDFRPTESLVQAKVLQVQWGVLTPTPMGKYRAQKVGRVKPFEHAGVSLDGPVQVLLLVFELPSQRVSPYFETDLSWAKF